MSEGPGVGHPWPTLRTPPANRLPPHRHRLRVEVWKARGAGRGRCVLVRGARQAFSVGAAIAATADPGTPGRSYSCSYRCDVTPRGHDFRELQRYCDNEAARPNLATRVAVGWV